MTSSQNPEQKLIYQDVMKKSLQVMQDSAHAMFNKHLVELKNNLSSDLNSYLTAPSSENQEKVLDDIQQIKRNED